MSLAFLFLLVGSSAQSAPTLEQIFVHRLIKAHRPIEVERTQRKFARWQVLRLSCQQQITRGDIPASCYARIKLEQKWGVVAASDQFEDLNERCRRATRALRLPAPMADLRDLSPSCRDQVLVGQKIEAYRRREVRNWSTN